MLKLRHIATLAGAVVFLLGGVAIAETGFNQQNISVLALGAAMLGVAHVAGSTGDR